MLVFVLYLTGCFVAGLSSRRWERRHALGLLAVCIAVAAAYYWVDSARALRVTIPPDRTVFKEEIPQYAIDGGGAAAAWDPTTSIAWAIFIGSVVVTIRRPAWGLCLMVLLTLVADPVLAPWFPIVKGFSSRESILYVADWLVVSPLEVLILIALAVWAADAIRTRRLGVPPSAMLLAATAFAIWLMLGLVRGVVSGGDVNVALWELRGPAYLLPVLALTLRFIRTKAQMVALMAAAMIANVIDAAWITSYVMLGLGAQQEEFRAFSDHATSVHTNTAFVLMAAAWVYRSSPAIRFGLPLLLPPLVISYVVNQRRAAFFALAVALGLLAIAAAGVNRRLLRRLVPLAGVVAVAWLVLGWNAPGGLGLPARTLKSILNSTERSLDDRESDYYRVLEDTNIIATIRHHPWVGVGFGQPFDLVVPLPAIPFIWWRYITHNAVLWVWMKAGLGGFLALLFLWGVAIATGADVSQRVRDNDLGAIVSTAVLFVIMHAIYAFVDMAWDFRSTVYLGATMGLIAGIDQIARADRQSRDVSPLFRRTESRE